MNSSEKVFYGENTNFSYAACQWIEKQSELIGKHIHHALCGHGGEFYVEVKDEERRKILTRRTFRLMDMNQNQILFFNITGANGTDVHVKREKKEIHLKKRKRRRKIHQNNRPGKKDEGTGV